LNTNYFPSDYEEFIYKSRYSRWLPDQNRREDWPETVDRYIDYMVSQSSYSLSPETIKELRQAILTFNVMPSMRALMTAGKALERDNVAGYNCSYLPVDSIESFDESMYILMNGTGVGFSVEERYVSLLPIVPPKLDMHFDATTYTNTNIIVVADSKEGWATGLRTLITFLYAGIIPDWDVTKVRAAGERLHTFGGRASGPKPLVELFQFVIDKFIGAQGRQLTALECHDIMCKIGEIVVVGGVRRSAMISLSDLNNSELAEAKSGEWWKDNPQRALANNSVVYEDKPDIVTFIKEWTALIESNSGERGLYNRNASVIQAGKSGRRNTNWEFGTNPCSEIILRPYQFCNLTEVVIKSHDTKETLANKVRIASILGTMQSLLTNFPYLRPIWKSNTEEERLLGVSLTGIMDNALTNGTNKESLPDLLQYLKQVAIATNKEYAEKFGIPVSAAITCVKPSGTVSQLVDSASGIHTRYNDFYIRTVRADNKDPLTTFLKDHGVPNEPAIGKEDTTTIFAFPKKAPDMAILRHDLSAIEQLEMWELYQDNWCEHKPSATVYVKPNEWLEVGAWVYERLDKISGVSFLPSNDHSYAQAPYQDITENMHKELVSEFPTKINWDALATYEFEAWINTEYLGRITTGKTAVDIDISGTSKVLEAAKDSQSVGKFTDSPQDKQTFMTQIMKSMYEMGPVEGVRRATSSYNNIQQGNYYGAVRDWL